jgi:hypothetical protein
MLLVIAESIILCEADHHTLRDDHCEYDDAESIILSALSSHTESIIFSPAGADSMMLSASAESIILSVGGAERMMLSVCAERIILSVSGAESMMLSALSVLSPCWSGTAGSPHRQYPSDTNCTPSSGS